MKRLKTYFFIKLSVTVGFFLVSLLAYKFYALLAWSQRPLPVADERVIEVNKGMPLKALAERLSEAKLIDEPSSFIYWVKIQGTFRAFQAGTYQFQGEVSPEALVAKITSGETFQPLVLQFTIPEGFTLAQITERLSALGLDDLTSLRRLVYDPVFNKSLGVDEPSLEGYLYPATYRYYRQMPSSREVLKSLVDEFYTRLPTGYREAVGKLGITLREAVIIASMIEKETLLDEERPMISEVIWRRLRDRVPLGIDATLIYGIKDYDGNIRRRHLLDASNRYNTRIHPGLPPSPIGSPSRASLEAVVTPSNAGHYFYVLLSGSEKKHHFSKTLKEHNRYVEKLVRALKAENANPP